jgi:Uma2 family endonuclease
MATTLSSSSPLALPPALVPPSAYPMEWTFADVQERLGGIPPERIHLYPWPGLATEKDVLEIHARTGRLCELVDGILVEKPVGFYESAIAIVIGHCLRNYLEGRPLGIVGGADGMLKILPGRIRIPDVSFIRWDRLPQGRDPVPAVAPDLAVEVLSESNTEREMQDKLGEYFAGGTRLAWIIDPLARTARIYHVPDQFTLIDEAGSLTGGDVLPGFELKLKELFAELERPENV